MLGSIFGASGTWGHPTVARSISGRPGPMLTSGLGASGADPLQPEARRRRRRLIKDHGQPAHGLDARELPLHAHGPLLPSLCRRYLDISPSGRMTFSDLMMEQEDLVEDFLLPMEAEIGPPLAASRATSSPGASRITCPLKQFGPEGDHLAFYEDFLAHPEHDWGACSRSRRGLRRAGIPGPLCAPSP